MDQKTKIILGGSLTINVILIMVLVAGYVKVNTAHEQLFMTEVQHNFVELEGLIAHQKEKEWTEPNLVTSQLSDVINGIIIATRTGEYSGWLSKEDRKIMNSLYVRLKQYPQDELYNFAELTQDDKEKLEKLRTKLREVGWGMEIQHGQDWESFMEKSEKLVDLLDR